MVYVEIPAAGRWPRTDGAHAFLFFLDLKVAGLVDSILRLEILVSSSLIGRHTVCRLDDDTTLITVPLALLL
jgi:hypothetical protein